MQISIADRDEVMRKAMPIAETLKKFLDNAARQSHPPKAVTIIAAFRMLRNMQLKDADSNHRWELEQIEKAIDTAMLGASSNLIIT